MKLILILSEVCNGRSIFFITSQHNFTQHQGKLRYEKRFIPSRRNENSGQAGGLRAAGDGIQTDRLTRTFHP